MARSSQMAHEAAEAAAGARRQIEVCRDRLADVARWLRAAPPPLVATCARGSSDHAALYGKYLIERSLGRAVASIGPSVVTFGSGAPLQLAGALFVTVSQSGRSPDLLRLTEAARERGALVVGLINDEASPLATACDIVLPLCAGEERSVAATKTCLLAAFGFLQLAAAWSGDPGLADAVARTPELLEAAAALDWAPALLGLSRASSLFVIARGAGLGAAHEIALKLQETCGMHAQAFSAAEVLHGPVALVRPGFPVIALAVPEHATTLVPTLARLRALGAEVVSTLDDALPVVANAPPAVAPLAQLQSFYLAVPQLSFARGLDPDAPGNLRKITETL